MRGQCAPFYGFFGNPQQFAIECTGRIVSRNERLNPTQSMRSASGVFALNVPISPVRFPIPAQPARVPPNRPAPRPVVPQLAVRRRVRIQFYLYSKISPGWHSSALQIASRVDSRIAFALPFFKTEMLAIVIPTFSASSVTLIFLLASMTSMLMIIAISLNS